MSTEKQINDLLAQCYSKNNSKMNTDISNVNINSKKPQKSSKELFEKWKFFYLQHGKSVSEYDRDLNIFLRHYSIKKLYELMQSDPSIKIDIQNFLRSIQKLDNAEKIAKDFDLNQYITYEDYTSIIEKSFESAEQAFNDKIKNNQFDNYLEIIAVYRLIVDLVDLIDLWNEENENITQFGKFCKYRIIQIFTAKKAGFFKKKARDEMEQELEDLADEVVKEKERDKNKKIINNKNQNIKENNEERELRKMIGDNEDDNFDMRNPGLSLCQSVMVSNINNGKSFSKFNMDKEINNNNNNQKNRMSINNRNVDFNQYNNNNQNFGYKPKNSEGNINIKRIHNINEEYNKGINNPYNNSTWQMNSSEINNPYADISISSVNQNSSIQSNGQFNNNNNCNSSSSSKISGNVQKKKINKKPQRKNSQDEELDKILNDLKMSLNTQNINENTNICIQDSFLNIGQLKSKLLKGYEYPLDYPLKINFPIQFGTEDYKKCKNHIINDMIADISTNVYNKNLELALEKSKMILYFLTNIMVNKK